MEFNALAAQANAVRVHVPIYEGPLALLLYLIEKEELDITRLALAQVTDQYLEQLHHIQQTAPQEISAFLVIAARLLQIKSEALLPRFSVEQPEENEFGESLAEQLRVYRQFKTAAEYLSKRDADGLRTYLRLAPAPKVTPHIDLSGFSVLDLASAARDVLSKSRDRYSMEVFIPLPRVTIREKIIQITRLLKEKSRASFQMFISQSPSRLEVVVSFLALLELVKRHFVLVAQDKLFGDIAIEKAASWDEDVAFDLEFGE